MISALCLVTLFSALIAGWWYPGVLIGGIFFTYVAGALSSHGWVGSLYVAVAAGMTLLRYVLRPHRPGLSAIDATMLGLTLFLCCSQFWSPFPDDTAAMSAQLVLSVVGMVVIARFQREPLVKLLTEMNICIVVVGAIMAIGMLAERVTGGSYSQNTRLLISNEDASAVGMTQPLPFAMFASLALLFFARSWLVRAAAIGSLGIVVYTSIVAATRSIFLSFIIAGILTLVVGARRIPARRYLIGAFATMAGVVVILSVIPEEQLSTSLGRLLGNFGSKGVTIDASGAERLLLYRTAEDLFGEFPFVGSAYGTFSHYAFQSYPHNLFLEIASSGGVVGLALLVLWLVSVLAGIFKIYRWDTMCGAILFGYFVTAFVQLQVSFAFFMARPLFLVSAMVAAYTANEAGRRALTVATGMRRSRQRPGFGIA